MKTSDKLLLFFITSIILCFVNILIGLFCVLIFITIILAKAMDNKKKKVCTLCNNKLTLSNTCANGRLKDGGQLCRSCLRRLDRHVRMDTEQYTRDEIIAHVVETENNKMADKRQSYFQKRPNHEMEIKEYIPTVKRVLQQGEIIDQVISARYNDNSGALTLTNKRLMIVYRKPIRKLASNDFLSETYYANLFTYDDLKLGSISDVQLKQKFMKTSICLFISNYMVEILCYCFDSEADEMVRKIKERSESAESKNQTITITLTNAQEE